MNPQSYSLTTTSPKPKGVKVPPLRIVDIRTIANKARDLFNIDSPQIDVIHLYEVELHKLGVTYEYCDKTELTNEAGLTFPNEGVIKIREDVYERAHEQNGFDRFTMCHEVGHLILHDNINIAFSRNIGTHKFFEDSEWQADTFAAEFMMPVPLVIEMCSCPIDVIHTFGVSSQAANLRWEKLIKQGVI